MDYETRIVCFIDVLGFKNKIKESESNKNYIECIFNTINDLSSEKILTDAYRSIRAKGHEVDDIKRMLRAASKKDFLGDFSDKYNIEITQFSDCFVLSCSMDDAKKCSVFLRCLYLINLMFFFNAEMLVRGGICIGPLLHKKNGALFGPAMNLAYELESSKAVTPRIITQPETYDLLKSKGVELSQFTKSNDSGNYFKCDIFDVIKNCEDYFTDAIDELIHIIREIITNMSNDANKCLEEIKDECKRISISNKHDYISKRFNEFIENK